MNDEGSLGRSDQLKTQDDMLMLQSFLGFPLVTVVALAPALKP